MTEEKKNCEEFRHILDNNKRIILKESLDYDTESLYSDAIPLLVNMKGVIIRRYSESFIALQAFSSAFRLKIADDKRHFTIRKSYPIRNSSQLLLQLYNL